jgi:hypothetical protein
MQRKLFFGLAVFFIAMLAFMPAKVMAQMDDQSDSARMKSPSDVLDQTVNDDYDFSAPAQAGSQDAQRNQEPARSGSMDQNVTRTPEQTRTMDRAAAGSPSNQAKDQATRSAQPQTIQGTVTGIDKPDGCLRIRAEATSSSNIIGCAKMGEELQLSGTYSSDGRWAKLANEGWVFSNQIDAPNKPRVQTQARRSSGGATYSTEEFDDSSLWQEPATSYYGRDYYTPNYGYGPSIGFGWGGGRGWRGGNWHGGGGHRGMHGGGGFHGGFHGGGGHRR